MDHLLKHLQIKFGEIASHRDSAADFVEFSLGYLAANPVVGTVSVDVGIGLRLADNTVVRMAGPPERPALPSYAVTVSKPGFDPTTCGTLDAGSIPVTGKNP